MKWRLIFALAGLGGLIGLASLTAIDPVLFLTCWIVSFLTAGILTGNGKALNSFVNGFAAGSMIYIMSLVVRRLFYPVNLAQHQIIYKFDGVIKQYHLYNGSSTVSQKIVIPLLLIIFSGTIVGVIAFVVSRIKKRS